MTPIFQDILENDDLKITADLTAENVAGWDSLAHVNILIALEREFGIRFDVLQVGNLKNIQELATLIETKVS